MQRCLSCNGIMTKSETVCYSCGDKTGLVATGAKASRSGFTLVVSAVFYLSIGLTGVSIFTSFGPPLAVCVPITLVLMFVKSSADQLKKNQT
jgi:hypothetical protein